MVEKADAENADQRRKLDVDLNASMCAPSQRFWIQCPSSSTREWL